VAHILILYKLKPGVTPKDFERWLRTSSAPTLRRVRRLKDFSVYRVEKRVMDGGEPSIHYAELFDIPDIEGFVREDIPGPVLQKDMEGFLGFAEKPEYLLATSLI